MSTLSRITMALKTAACPELWRMSPRQWRALARIFRATRPSSAPSATLLTIFCPPVGSTAFRRHMAGLSQIARGDYVPLVAHIAVTDRCPFSCRRCSNIPTGAEPDFVVLASVLHQLEAAGTANIAFTGGEPLLREDLPDLVAACRPTISPILFTTGWSLTDSVAARLRSSGLTAAFVSLDHYEPDPHNCIRGRDAFDTAVRAIGLFRDHGIHVAAQAVATRDLLIDDTLNRFLGFCRSLKVDEVMLLEHVAVPGRCETCDPLDDEHHRLLHQLHRRSAASRSLPKIETMSFLEGPDFLGCQAGFCFLYITTVGEVYPCDFVPLCLGNVFDTGLPIILERLKSSFPRPARSCLALDLQQMLPVPTSLPLDWAAAQPILAKRDPGPVPPLMRALLRMEDD